MTLGVELNVKLQCCTIHVCLRGLGGHSAILPLGFCVVWESSGNL